MQQTRKVDEILPLVTKLWVLRVTLGFVLLQTLVAFKSAQIITYNKQHISFTQSLITLLGMICEFAQFINCAAQFVDS